VLVSSADETAFEVRRLLQADIRVPISKGRHEFITSGDVETFRHLGARFLGPEVDSVEAWTWS
jgi:glutamate racemase